MYAKKITYVDYNGDTRTETFYFNLTKAELAHLEFSRNGGISEALRVLLDANDRKALLDIFDEIILSSYGEKSEDGRRFMKNPEIRKAFEETPAYSDIYMELISDPNKTLEFIRGVLPADISAKIAEKEKELLDAAKKTVEKA